MTCSISARRNNMLSVLFLFSFLYLILVLPFTLSTQGAQRGIFLFVAIMVGSYAWQQIQNVRDQYYDPTESRYGINENQIVENKNNYGGDKVWREQFNAKLTQAGIPEDLWQEYEETYIDYEVLNKYDKWGGFSEESAEIRDLPYEGYLSYRSLRKGHIATFKVEKEEVFSDNLKLRYESNLAAWKQAMEDKETLMMIYWVVSMVAVSEVFNFLTGKITIRNIANALILLGIFLLIMPILFVIFPGFFHIQDDYLGPYYFKTCWNLWTLWFPMCSVAVVSVLTAWGVAPTD